MKRVSIGTRHEMPVQPAFIIGTFNEDGSPDFAPITWVSKTYECDRCLIIISMYGTKQTKLNTMRTGLLTVNLVSRDMLPLMDYFGQTSGKDGVKNELEYTWSRAECIDAPTLDDARWVCECEVVSTVPTGESHTFFCRIHNVQLAADAREDDSGIDLTSVDAVVYSGRYQSIGECLGRIGDYYPTRET